jgi:arsenate reductase
MPLRLYAYKNCDTCRKAQKFLEASGIPFELLAIRDTPPSAVELQWALAGRSGNLKDLFNTSGMDYRSGDWKAKLPQLSETEALQALTQNGNLNKRPLLVDTQNQRAINGFRQDEWQQWLNTAP